MVKVKIDKDKNVSRSFFSERGLTFRNYKLLVLMGIFIFNINLISAGLYYDVSLYYNRGSVEVWGVDVKFSNYEIENYANEEVFLVYSLKIADSNGRVLDESFFNIPNKQLYDIADNETGIVIDGGEIELDNVSFSIEVPYYENAKEIVIYNEKRDELVRKDISEFSKDYAGDGMVIGGEKDEHGCLIAAGYSWCESKQKCLRSWEEECLSQVEDGEAEILNGLKEYYWVLGVILIILVIVFIYLMKKGKKR